MSAISSMTRWQKGHTADQRTSYRPPPSCVIEERVLHNR